MCATQQGQQRRVCYLNMLCLFYSNLMLCSTYVLDIELSCKELTFSHFLTKANPKQNFVQTAVTEYCKGKPRAWTNTTSDHLRWHLIWLSSLASLLTARGQMKILVKDNDTFCSQNFNMIKKFPPPFSYFPFLTSRWSTSTPFHVLWERCCTISQKLFD